MVLKTIATCLETIGMGLYVIATYWQATEMGLYAISTCFEAIATCSKIICIVLPWTPLHHV